MQLVILISLIVISALTAVIQFASSEGKLLDNRKQGLNKVNQRGWLVVISFLLITFLSLLLYSLQKIESDKLALENDHKRRISDSTIISDFNHTLNKYGLDYKAQQHRIVQSLNDSLFNRTIDLNQSVPNLSLSFEGGIDVKYRTPEAVIANVNLESYEAASTDVSLTVRLVTYDSETDHYQVYNELFPFSISTTIPAKHRVGSELRIAATQEIDVIFLLVAGTYKNNNRTKTYSMNQIGLFDLKKNIFGFPPEKEKEELIKMISFHSKKESKP